MLPTLSLGSTKSSRGIFCECKHDLTGLSLTAAFSVWLVQTRSTAYVKIWQSGSSRGGRAHFQGEKGVTALCPKSSNFRQHCQPQRAFSGIKYFFLFFYCWITSFWSVLSAKITLGKHGVGQRGTGSPHPEFKHTSPNSRKVTYSNQVAHSRLHSSNRRWQIWNRFSINFTFFVHNHQMGYLLSHRLQDTFYRLRVENRHGDNFRALSKRKENISNHLERWTPERSSQNPTKHSRGSFFLSRTV